MISIRAASDTKRDSGLLLGSLVLVNLLIWIVALLTFHHYALIAMAGTAYFLGLRHALDADHIAAIDNVTRKLMQERQRPMLVGFFFSLGHSAIVVVLSVCVAVAAGLVQSKFPGLLRFGGLVGTSASAFFLILMAGINLLVLRSVMSAFGRVKRGESYSEQDVDAALNQLGFLGRIFHPVVRLVDRSWKMFFVGFVFGLGFDTATEIGLLGISAAAATQHMPVGSILLFPLLFTAGMCLVDTLDGIMMVGAYGWAYVHPVRKLYYNMTITAVSVVIAMIIGGVEVLGMVGEQMDLHSRFWNTIGSLDNHFGAMGVTIVGIFLFSWLGSALFYRLMGYQRLELAVSDLSV